MRRRRTKYNWLPILGTQLAQDPDNTSSRFFTQVVPKNGTTQISFANLTFDNPKDSENATLADPLVDFIGSEYVLKRIVGKIHCGIEAVANAGNPVEPVSVNNVPSAVLVCVAFFVARQEDGVAVDVPIGTSTDAQAIENYSPQDADNQREPWIWRRTWILGNPLRKNEVVQDDAFKLNVFGVVGSSEYPSTNAGYGSIMDGPHIDSKVARRIRQEDRLYCVSTVRNYPPGTTVEDPAEGTVQTFVRTNVDVRLLGALRKARNKSSF